MSGREPTRKEEKRREKRRKEEEEEELSFYSFPWLFDLSLGFFFPPHAVRKEDMLKEIRERERERVCFSIFFFLGFCFFSHFSLFSFLFFSSSKLPRSLETNATTS